jgi:hypothetical protein
MRRSLVLVAVLFSFFVAQTASATSDWRYDRIVQKLQISSDGNFIMYLPTGTDLSCQEGGSRFNFTAGASSQTVDGIKAHLAALLMASAMGKSISFAYDSVGGVCTVAGVVINL